MEAGEVKFGLALGVSAAAFIVSLLNAITGDGLFSGIGDWLSEIIRRRRTSSRRQSRCKTEVDREAVED